MQRRDFLIASAATLGLAAALAGDRLRSGFPGRPRGDIFDQVTPEEGIDTGLSFGDSLHRLMAGGALDPAKLRSSSHDLPGWVERLLAGPSIEPIVFNRDRAPYLVNLLWPVGLANRAAFNQRSALNTGDLPNFASTGGWTLGHAANGAVYFNKINVIPLTDRQESLVLDVATNSFRPCCDNSTFFQDCNHGSALLGLIELAAAQGRDRRAIYRAALAANSYWFAEEYTKTALYFSHFEGQSWNEIEPAQVLAAKYSSLGGWQRNVAAPLARAKVHLPAEPGVQPGCGV